MQVELKTLLGSGGEGFLLSGGVIRELNGFVDGWEVNKGWEKTNPMKTTSKDVFLINILIDIVPNQSVFGWLNTFNSNGNVDNKSHKTEAEWEAAASLSCSHSWEWVCTIFKTILHL